jgi:hypothetical protein
MIAAIVLVAIWLFGARFARPDAPGVAACGALALAALALADDPARRRRARALALAGAISGGLFVVAPAAWLDVTALAAMGLAWVALLPEWRGLPRDPRRLARDAALVLGPASAVPALLGSIAALAGSTAIFASDLRFAWPASPWTRVASGAASTLFVVLVADGARVSRSRARGVAWLTFAAIVAWLAARVAWIGSLAALPMETFWSEAPVLQNALKLDAGEPLYGPPGDLDSYTYSPLLDLLHHALLRPFGLELSLHAHRALVIADELAAIAVLAWALGPKVRRAGDGLGPLAWPFLVATLTATGLSSLLAATVHPEHLVVLCFAVAIAIVAAEDRWRRGAWWAALVLVTPVAAAAKLPAAGLGLGLAAAYVVERRWRVVAALAASGAMTLATPLLFDATLGRFTFYAIRVQASHPVEWDRLRALPSAPIAIATFLAAAAVAALARTGGVPRDVKRVAIVTASMALLSLPAYGKHAGREHNLVTWFVGAIAVLLLACASFERARPHPALPYVAAFVAVFAWCPMRAPMSAAGPQATLDAMVARIDADEAAGRRTLLLVATTPWIATGHRTPLRDREQSAVELFFGHIPEGDLLFARIESGEYDTVITNEGLRSVSGDPSDRFAVRLAASLAGRYAPCDPDGPPFALCRFPPP